MNNQFKHWYDLPEDEIGEAVAQVIHTIDQNNNDMRERFAQYATIYRNDNFSNWNSFTSDTQSTNRPPLPKNG